MEKNKGEQEISNLFETTQQFFDMWLKNYQSTIGKLAQVPAIGPIREKQEKLMNGIPICTNLFSTWIESSINFQTISMEAMRRTYEKTINDMKGEITPEKYKRFYEIWINTFSETFKEYLKSGHIASDMGKLTSEFIEYQKYNREITEENFLKPNNLPTKTDIEQINKELYNLKQIVKEQAKLIKEMESKIEEKQEQPAEEKQEQPAEEKQEQPAEEKQ